MSIKRSMKKSISSDICSMGDVLKDNYFKIPFYQRDYAWGRTQVKDLWNDLMDVFNGVREDHFFGQIVTYDDENYQDVIDGQQRITTSSILIAAIKYWANKLLKDEKIDQKSVTSLDIIVRDIDNYMKIDDPDRVTTLTVQKVSSDNNAIQNYFLKLMDGNYEMSTEEKKLTPIKNINTVFTNLKSNIKKLLDKKISSEKIKSLRKLLDTFTDQFFVSMVETERQGDAFIIFESLNSTGKNLEPSEIIKTYLMSQVSKENDEIKDDFNDKWSKLDFKFNKDTKKLTKFIRTYWAARNSLNGVKQLYRSISQEIIGSDKAREFLDDLLRISDYYLVVDNGCKNKKDIDVIGDLETKNILWMMNKMGCVTYYPVLFAMKLRDYDVEDIRKVIHKILCVFTRTVTICGYNTNSLETNFALVAESIWKQEIITPDEINSNMTDKMMPKDYEVRSAFQTLSMENKQGAKGWSLKYLLFNIYKYYGDFDGIPLNEIGENKYNVLKIDGSESSDENNTNSIGNYVLIEGKVSSDIEREHNYEDVQLALEDPESKLGYNKQVLETIDDNGTWNYASTAKRQEKWADIVTNIW